MSDSWGIIGWIILGFAAYRFVIMPLLKWGLWQIGFHATPRPQPKKGQVWKARDRSYFVTGVTDNAVWLEHYTNNFTVGTTVDLRDWDHRVQNERLICTLNKA